MLESAEAVRDAMAAEGVPPSEADRDLLDAPTAAAAAAVEDLLPPPPTPTAAAGSVVDSSSVEA